MLSALTKTFTARNRDVAMHGTAPKRLRLSERVEEILNDPPLLARMKNYMAAAPWDVDKLVSPERDPAAVRKEELVLEAWTQFLKIIDISKEEVPLGANISKYALGFYHFLVRSVSDVVCRLIRLIPFYTDYSRSHPASEPAQVGSDEAAHHAPCLRRTHTVARLGAQQCWHCSFRWSSNSGDFDKTVQKRELEARRALQGVDSLPSPGCRVPGMYVYL